MQSLEVKKTEKVDWLSALTKFIKKEYVKDTFEAHKDAADKVNALRRDLQSATERSEIVASMYLRYWHVLAHIDQRFPVNEDNIKVQFTWYDAFKGKQKSALYRVNFERACLLYNVAAIYSYLGAHQNLATMDGLKDACRYFQMSAGFLAQLKEDIMFVVGGMTPDMSTEGLDAALYTVLGQAQECFTERAFRQNMKPSVVAPLAASAARFYDKAVGALDTPLLKASVEKSYALYAPFKFNYMMALHHLCLARIAHDEEKYGVEVAHAQLADQHLARCRSFAVAPDVQALAANLAPVVARTCASAVSDNERIYHERVPRPEELPAAAVKDMVKPAAIQAQLDGARAGSEMFGNLLPLAVKKSIDKYNEDKQRLLVRFQDELKESSKGIQDKLAELNLPDCLHIMEAVAIPEGLQRDIQAFKASNGVAYLLDFHAQVQSMSEEARKMHRSIIDSLDTEEHEDTELCQRFGRVWSRMPSSQLNRSFRGDLANYTQSVDAAKRSDAVLQRKFESYRPEFELLMLPLEQLEALVPRGAPTSLVDAPVEQKDASAELKDMLTQFDAIIAERQKLAKDAEQVAAQEGGITNNLLLGGRPHDDIIAQALTAFDPLRQRAAELLQQQTGMIEKLVATHKEFIAQRHNSELLTQKETAIKRLRDAVNHYKEIKGNITEGMEFYSRMHDVLRQLKMKVDDFLYARATEKGDLMQRIQMMTPQQGPGPAPGSGGAPMYQQPPSVMQQHLPPSAQHQPVGPQQHQAPPPQQPMYTPTYQAPFVPPTQPSSQGGEYSGQYRR